MAQKVTVELVDDLDGSVLGTDQASTVSFSLQNRAYEIDLSEENLGKLQDALEPFIKAGRRVAASSRTTTRRASRGSSATSGADLGAIREWARANGYTVSDRGRIAANVLAAYNAAH